jgi:mRNA-degrading endonuclease RelE of RelBE toxin-antitoxin system
LGEESTRLCHLIRESIESAFSDVLSSSEQRTLQSFLNKVDGGDLTRAVTAGGIERALADYWSTGQHPKAAIEREAVLQEKAAHLKAEEARRQEEALEQARRQKDMARWQQEEARRQKEVARWQEEEARRQKEKARWQEEDARRQQEVARWGTKEARLPKEMARWQEEDACRQQEVARWQGEEAHRQEEMARWQDEKARRQQEVARWTVQESRDKLAEAAPVIKDWKLRMTDDFIKSTKSVDKKVQGHIFGAIKELSRSPVTRVGDTIMPLTGNMAGLWRYRIGDYRLIYHPITIQKLVVLLSFAPRGAAYA